MNRKEIIVSILISFCIFLISFGGLDFLWESNRLLHVMGSAGLALLASYSLSRDFFSFFLVCGGVFFMGVFKELLDPLYDPLDILANGLGIGVAMVFFLIIRLDKLRL